MAILRTYEEWQELGLQVREGQKHRARSTSDNAQVFSVNQCFEAYGSTSKYKFRVGDLVRHKSYGRAIGYVIRTPKRGSSFYAVRIVAAPQSSRYLGRHMNWREGYMRDCTHDMLDNMQVLPHLKAAVDDHFIFHNHASVGVMLEQLVVTEKQRRALGVGAEIKSVKRSSHGIEIEVAVPPGSQPTSDVKEQVMKKLCEDPTPRRNKWNFSVNQEREINFDEIASAVTSAMPIALVTFTKKHSSEKFVWVGIHNTLMDKAIEIKVTKLSVLGKASMIGKAPQSDRQRRKNIENPPVFFFSINPKHIKYIIAWVALVQKAPWPNKGVVSVAQPNMELMAADPEVHADAILNAKGKNDQS